MRSRTTVDAAAHAIRRALHRCTAMVRGMLQLVEPLSAPANSDEVLVGRRALLIAEAAKDAVGAVSDLDRDPSSPAVLARLDQAKAAVKGLPQVDHAAASIRHLIEAVEECRSCGQRGSATLRSALRAMLVSLMADESSDVH